MYINIRQKNNVAEVIKEIESFVATHTHIYTQLNPIMIGPTGKFAGGQFMFSARIYSSDDDNIYLCFFFLKKNILRIMVIIIIIKKYK